MIFAPTRRRCAPPAPWSSRLPRLQSEQTSLGAKTVSKPYDHTIAKLRTTIDPDPDPDPRAIIVHSIQFSVSPPKRWRRTPIHFCLDHPCPPPSPTWSTLNPSDPCSVVPPFPPPVRVLASQSQLRFPTLAPALVSRRIEQHQIGVLSILPLRTPSPPSPTHTHTHGDFATRLAYVDRMSLRFCPDPIQADRPLPTSPPPGTFSAYALRGIGLTRPTLAHGGNNFGGSEPWANRPTIVGHRRPARCLVDPPHNAVCCP